MPSNIEIRGNYFAKPLNWNPFDPSYAGKPWSVKNLFELKNAQDVIVDGNLFEFVWGGPAILFNEVDGPASKIQNVQFTNNVVRANIAFDVCSNCGQDAAAPTNTITLRNNLFLQTKGKLFIVLHGVNNLTIDHNTAINEDGVVAVDNFPPSNNSLVFTNNITLHNADGVFGAVGIGAAALNFYFPGYVFSKNILVGGPAASYPANNFFPATLNDVGFTNLSAGNFRLAAGSPYKNAGTDGKDLGIDVDALATATAFALTGVPGAVAGVTAPTSDSVTPVQGTGTAQIFSFEYSDANGLTDLNSLYALFNSSLYGVNACYLAYNRAANALYLVNDANTVSLGPITPGSNATVQNSQCVLNGIGSTVYGWGATLTMNVSLNFKPGFAGGKAIYHCCPKQDE